MNSPTLFIALVSFLGLLLSLYIANTKRMSKPLVCPIGGHCDAVTHSDFSTFLGIPLEYLGIAYYGLATLAYLWLGVAMISAPVGLPFWVYIVTVLAFFFSLYLTFIQGFVIRQWCTWCLVSAGITALMFFLVASTSTLDWAFHVGEIMPILQFIVTLGLILGVGGTTIVDLLFFSFLKDLRISVEESSVIRTVTQVVWVGLAILLFSNSILYVGFPGLLANSAHRASIFVLAIILANAVFLNLLVAPNLVKISFKKTRERRPGELRFLRRFSFTLIAVSLVSWYALFVVYFLGNTSASLSSILGGYGLALLGVFALMVRVDKVLIYTEEANEKEAVADTTKSIALAGKNRKSVPRVSSRARRTVKKLT